ncbi:protein DpdG [Sorangium sp. So ce124]|uniref:protein DpdG n=1 Tax=Sorangium sp. So ce124 TaxID=3133280 RepID=UPI003F617DF1
MKLYTSFEAVPSRILGLARLLASGKRSERTREDVVALLQPPSLRKGESGTADMANRVIGAASELGLVDEFENARGEPSMRLSKLIDTSDPSREYLARWIARRVLHDLIEDASRNFALVLAWLMMIPSDDTPEDETAWKRRFSGDGFHIDNMGLNNDQRWQNVFYWSQFLGLTWQLSSTKASGIVCDPSTLINWFLDDLLPPGREITADAFRDKLGELFPTLDGGAIHREARAQIAKARGGSLEHEDRMSPGVSLALRELREHAKLHYHCPDDQRTFLLLDDGEKIAFVSRPPRAES